jgi:DNA polymerase III epsilon subunit-like protein
VKEDSDATSNNAKEINGTMIPNAATSSIGYIDKPLSLPGNKDDMSGCTLSENTSITSCRNNRNKRCVGLDCEMVGVGPMKVSVLARVSIVNSKGNCIFDSYVKVEEPVTDYRTAVSGIRPEDLQSDNAMSFGEVRLKVKKILNRCILIGHGLQNDLAVLHLHKSAYCIRDTTQYVPYMTTCWDGTYRPRRLRDLMWEKFGVIIQSNEHSSIDDAKAAMSLYNLVKHEWDSMYIRNSNEYYCVVPGTNSSLAHSFFLDENRLPRYEN